MENVQIINTRNIFSEKIGLNDTVLKYQENNFLRVCELLMADCIKM